MSGRALGALATAVAVALALSGCGLSGQPAGNRIHGRTLTIWVSAPLDGPGAAAGEAVVRGAALALAAVHARIGHYRIVMHHLDDSDPTTDRWDPGQTASNARIAIREPSTVGYIGEVDSGASAISVPILGAFGIPQISPASTAVGLTSAGPGANPGEPQKYYPRGERTFVRLPPSDLVQAEVQIAIQRAAGCRSTFVLDDADEVDGDDMAATFEAQAGVSGLALAGEASYEPAASGYTALAQSVISSGADCVLESTIADDGAARLTAQIATALPRAALFATAGLASSAFTDPLQGGIPIALDRRLLITAPAPDPTGAERSLAATFERSYTRRYRTPEPDAIYGYEGMALLLRAISRATDGGRHEAERSRVLAALMATRGRRSVLGDYSVLRSGDTTLDTYGVYRIRAGRLRLWRLAQAPDGASR